MANKKRLTIAVRKKTGGKLSPKRVVEIERHGEILNLRRAGATFEQIGERMGIAKQTAYKHVAREMQAAAAESRETGAEILELDLQRLDELFLAVFDKAVKGDMQAHTRALRNIDLRQKLMGNVDQAGPVNLNLGVGIAIELTVKEMAELHESPEAQEDFKRRYYLQLQTQYGDRIPDVAEAGQVLGAREVEAKEVATSKKNGTKPKAKRAKKKRSRSGATSS